MSREDIKPGYQVQVRSWENDGDNYKTEVVSGLSLEAAKLHVFIADAFSSRYEKRPENLPYSVSGNDENTLEDLIELWRYASEKYPEAAKKYFSHELPDETAIEAFAEYDILSYNSPKRTDKALREAIAPVTRFLDFFNDFVENMLSNAGEGYWDMEYFFRCADGIQVYYVPGAIENVTNQFINEKGKLI